MEECRYCSGTGKGGGFDEENGLPCDCNFCEGFGITFPPGVVNWQPYVCDDPYESIWKNDGGLKQ